MAESQESRIPLLGFNKKGERITIFNKDYEDISKYELFGAWARGIQDRRQFRCEICRHSYPIGDDPFVDLNNHEQDPKHRVKSYKCLNTQKEWITVLSGLIPTKPESISKATQVDPSRRTLIINQQPKKTESVSRATQVNLESVNSSRVGGGVHDSGANPRANVRAHPRVKLPICFCGWARRPN